MPFPRATISVLAIAGGVILISSAEVTLGQSCPAITDPAPLNTNAASDSGSDMQPQLTTDGQGNWVAVWDSYDDLGGTIGTDFDILFSRSTDAGATWTDPAPLNTNAASDSGVDGQPQLTTDGAGNWLAVWFSQDDFGGTIGTDRDILFSRSTDNGATWTAPAPLNTNAASDTYFDYRVQLTTDGQGNWVAVWQSSDDLEGTIGTDPDILFARSTDIGATWTAPAPLNTYADSDSSYDFNPQLTTDGQGNWVAVWESNDDLGGSIDTDYDVLVSLSTDAGASWTAPAALNTNAASDSGFDGYPQLTTDGQGNWVAVWSSTDDLKGTIGVDDDILFSRSTDAGATWTAPLPLNTNAENDHEGAFGAPDYSPQLTTDAQGNWVAVWYYEYIPADDPFHHPTEAGILLSRSTDSGATWTVPAPVNPDTPPATGADAPQLTTDAAGNWVAAWYTAYDLGGTIGNDFDILVARFELLPCPASFNGDCVVDAGDLAILLGNWGPCSDPCPPSCAGDLDGNCDVGPFDLALLLGNWGPCP